MTAMKSRFWILGLVAASLVLTGCPEKRRPAGSPAAKPAPGAPAKTADGAKPAGAQGPLADFAKNLSDSEKKATEVVGLSELNKAVQQFNVIEGRYPRTLDELVASRFLPKIPVAPRGKRFIYNPKSGEVTVEALPAAKPAEVPAAESAPVPQPTPAPAPAAETPGVPAE